MTKAAALQSFFAGFGLPAYEENSVPTGDDAPAFPYITYEYQSGAFGDVVPLSFSLWYKSTTWVSINAKAETISGYIGRGGVQVPCDGGSIWIVRGNPFSQHMAETDDNTIKRIVINITVAFMTAD